MKGPLKVDNPIISKINRYKCAPLLLSRVSIGRLRFRIVGFMFNMIRNLGARDSGSHMSSLLWSR